MPVSAGATGTSRWCGRRRSPERAPSRRGAARTIVALLHQVAHVRAAPTAQLAQRGPELLVQAPEFLVVSGVRRPGARSARQRISSANRLPTPAKRSWSMRRAFSGATVAAARPGADAPGPHASHVRKPSSASGPRRSSSGASSMDPNRRGSCNRSWPPSSKVMRTRTHLSWKTPGP